MPLTLLFAHPCMIELSFSPKANKVYEEVDLIKTCTCTCTYIVRLGFPTIINKLIHLNNQQHQYTTI